MNVPLTKDYHSSCGYGDFDTSVSTVTTLLSNREYVVGNHFTALDVYLSGLIAWGVFKAKALPSEVVLADYAKRHLSRPAYSFCNNAKQ